MIDIQRGDFFFQWDDASIVRPIHSVFTPFVNAPNHGGIAIDAEYFYEATPPKVRKFKWSIDKLARRIMEGKSRVEIWRFTDYNPQDIDDSLEAFLPLAPEGTPYNKRAFYSVHMLKNGLYCFQLQRLWWETKQNRKLPVFNFKRRHIIEVACCPVVLGARMYRAPGIFHVGDLKYSRRDKDFYVS